MRLLFAGLIALTTWAIFSGVRHGDFLLWDDDINVTENSHVQGLDASRLSWMFSDLSQAMRYKPLSWLAWALTYSFCGLAPLGYHLVNLLLHGLNAALVFLVIERLLRPPNEEPNAGQNKRRLFCAAGGAFLWAIHPMRVEPVAWVTGLPYCQSLFFLLISFWCYLFTAGTPGTDRKRPIFYCASVVAFGASLLSYPLGLAYAAVLVILDVYRWRQSQGFQTSRNGFTGMGRRVWLEKIPFALMSALFLGLALFGRIYQHGIWQQPVSLNDFGLASRIMQSFYVWAYYLWKPLLPFDLSPWYLTLIKFDPLDPPFVLSFALVILLTGILLWKRRSFPGPLALWLSYLALLVPVLGWTEHPHYASDRYSHVAHIALAVLAAGGLLKCWERPEMRLKAVGSVVGALTLFSFLSIAQIEFWRNNETLFRRMITLLGQSPARAELYYRLGNHYRAEKRLEESAANYEEALKILPMLTQAHYWLGEVRYVQGRKNEALVQYAEALRGAPVFPVAFRRLAEAQAADGHFEEAIAQWRASLRLEPNETNALNDLALILATCPQPSLRNGTEALGLAERACRLTGQTQAVYLATLGAAYAEAGKFPEAIQAAERSSALTPSDSPRFAELQSQLKLYRGAQPYRTPAKTEP